MQEHKKNHLHLFQLLAWMCTAKFSYPLPQQQRSMKDDDDDDDDDDNDDDDDDDVR